jgi:iron complex outermembrane receptor protein
MRHASPSPTLVVSPSARISFERLTLDPSGAPTLRAHRTFVRGALGGSFSPFTFLELRALASAECNGTGASGPVLWSFPAPVSDGASGVCDTFLGAGRVGFIAKTGAIALLGNAGRYGRVPTLAELYGISGAVRGNPAISPEQGVTVDLGVRAEPSGVLARPYVDAFAFRRSVSDLIAYQRSSAGYVRPYNVGRATVQGIELFVGARPMSFVTTELSATLLDARDRSPDRTGNDVLPYLPRLVTVPRIELHSRLPSPFQGGKIAAAYFYESSRYADRAGLIVVPAQGSLDVESELAFAGGIVVLRGRLANVLGQARADMVGYPLPGRAGYVALEVRTP